MPELIALLVGNMLMLYLSFYSKKYELEMLKYLLLERYRAQGSSSANINIDIIQQEEVVKEENEEGEETLQA